MVGVWVGEIVESASSTRHYPEVKFHCSGLQGFGFVATRFEELLIESQDHRFIRIPEGSVKLEQKRCN